jgi:hypothetical protein
MSQNIINSYLILADVYIDLEHIPTYEKRINTAKKISIKIILDRCQCNKCIEAAYFIHSLEFFI